MTFPGPDLHSPYIAKAPTSPRRDLAPVPADATQYAVRMRDGVELATDVYLPEDGGPWPVLLSRLPYDKAGEECFMPEVARWFTHRGYAVVVQDVRGKVRSGGEFVPYAFEASDGYDTLDWVSRQEWSTGLIGMIGDSYYGFTQWAAASSRHPALRAITPRVCSTDFQRALTTGEVMQLESLVCWAAETWIDEGLYDVEDRLDWSTRPMSEIIPTALGGRRSPGLDDLVLDGAPETMSVVTPGDVPALHLGGFADILFDGQLETWRQARAGSAPHYLVLDHTDHGWTPLRAPGEPYSDPTANPAAMRRFLASYLEPLLPFLDHFVRGHGDYDEPRVRWRAGRDNTWRSTTDWPPPSSVEHIWHLAEERDRLVLQTTRADSAAVTWMHRPNDPVPSLIHPYYPHIDPADESGIQGRDDVLIFGTHDFEQPVLLAGPVRLSGSLSSDGEGDSTHVMVTLYDVSKDGRWHRITEGAARVTCSSRRASAFSVDLRDAGYLIQPGHGIAVAIASSSFPRYELNPGTHEHPWTATSTAETRQTLRLGGSEPATLTCFIEPQETSTS